MASLARAPLNHMPPRNNSVVDLAAILSAVNSSRAETNTSLVTIGTGLNNLNVNVAGLQERVSHLGENLKSLNEKVGMIERGKAEREDLTAVKVGFEKAVSEFKEDVERDLRSLEDRTISRADFDKDAFQNMYESLVDEMKDIGTKIDDLKSFKTDIKTQEERIKAQGEALSSQIKGHDDRLTKIEPLRDTYLKALGAKWAIAVGASILGSAFTLGLVKLVFK